MTRDEIIAQMIILIDKAAEEGYHMGYMGAVDDLSHPINIEEQNNG